LISWFSSSSASASVRVMVTSIRATCDSIIMIRVVFGEPLK
jgi:hypothetical protein